MNTKEVHTFKDKGMQTQYEVKFLQSVFSLNDEYLQGLYMAQFIAFKWT
jgi:hypothetical protein